MASKKTATKQNTAKTVVETAAETVKTTEVKKATEKKTTRKAAAKETIMVQYLGTEVNTADLMKKVKEYWTKQLKNKVGDIKTITLYVKPEEAKTYFVINEEVTGSVDM